MGISLSADGIGDHGLPKTAETFVALTELTGERLMQSRRVAILSVLLKLP